MRLFEIYKEDPSSTFVHDGKSYDINKLFKLTAHLKPELYRVSDLTWVLNFDEPVPDDYETININIPVLITKWYDMSVGAWRHTVIDGLHRLNKARINKVSHIQGKMVSKDILDSCLF
ncbi:MAG: hypothetical protein M0R77_03105 [Gammaproteobacteria bacterium]|nr:hypothetical protein [Gammaproteobacteria bacterium]